MKEEEEDNADVFNFDSEDDEDSFVFVCPTIPLVPPVPLEAADEWLDVVAMNDIMDVPWSQQAKRMSRQHVQGFREH